MGEPRFCLKLFRRICEGVLVIHEQGIIHRDLKPSNILLVNDEKDIRIGDFGICYIDIEKDEHRITSIREMVGPVYFSAPEQTLLPPDFSTWSDIYSLGRILYFMLTGRYKFSPSSGYLPVAKMLQDPQLGRLDKLIVRMISFDPKNRPASVKTIIKELDDILTFQKQDYIV